MISRLWRLLHSSRLALGLLISISLYSLIAAWLPWTRAEGVAPPPWAVSTGLDRPFSNVVFVSAFALLFLNVFGCTWERTKRVAAFLGGKFPAGAVSLPAIEGADFAGFIKQHGFKAKGPTYFKRRLALSKGWLMHVGFLVLIAGVITQRAFHDGGKFEITEGARVNLSAPGVVFGRESGIFAPKALPDIEIGLVSFDAFLHQEGYAPDRMSRLQVSTNGEEPHEVSLDRAKGIKVGEVTIYQAIPTGLSIIVDIGGKGARSIHLREASERVAIANVVDPSGKPGSFVLESERAITDPVGTGEVKVKYEQDGNVVKLSPGEEFRFGDQTAKFLKLARWGGFTYAYSPGMWAIFLGFFLVISGSAVLVLPAGVAEAADPRSGAAGRVYLTRDAAMFLDEWEREGHNNQGEPIA